MITTITGKNQITVPAEIVGKAGLKAGTRLDWRMTEQEGVIEIRVLPDQAALAAGLRGRGKAYRRLEGSAVERLQQERDEEEKSRGSR